MIKREAEIWNVERYVAKSVYYKYCRRSHNYFPFPDKMIRSVWIMILKSRAREIFSM